MKNLMILFSLIGIAVLSTGCDTTSQASKTYTRGEAQRAMEVYYGTVLSVADVTIETEESGAGAVVGGVAGGIAGSTIGGGDGTKLATAAGAIVGAALGSAAEKARGKKQGVEIEVEMDDGRIMVIVQEKDDEFYVGDRVRIIESGYGKLRVRQ